MAFGDPWDGTLNHSHSINYGINDATTIWTWPPQTSISAGNITYWPESQATEKERKPGMRGLFEVFFVDPEKGTCFAQTVVVAKDEATAKIKALRGEAHLDGADLDDYDIIVRRLGDVRPKKEPVVVNIANK